MQENLLTFIYLCDKIKLYTVICEEVAMRLDIKNIGLFNSASIVIDGITVLAGENASGKSTVSKALYAVFHGMSSYRTKINERRIMNISNLISRLPINISKYPSGSFASIGLRELSEKIFLNRDVYMEDQSLLRKELIDFYNLDADELGTSDALSETITRILESLKLSDDAILISLMNESFNNEFNSEIVNRFVNDDASLELSIKNESIGIGIKNDAVDRVTNPIELIKDIVYIDDPYVLDDLNYFRFIKLNNGSHRDDLFEKLTLKNSDTIEGIKVNEKLSGIFEKLESINLGSLVNKAGVYKYTDPKSMLDLDVRNIATGLKAFIIIKTLLENGSLEERGTIILDEPEIHLHPKWQVILAELIVLIHKTFNMHVLLNTHSPYFLRAIEVYSMKYGVDGSNKYYLVSRNDNNVSSIEDVSDDTGRIYELLAEPLDMLNEVLDDEE